MRKEEKVSKELLIQAEKLSEIMLRAIYDSEGDDVSSSALLYALTKMTAGVLAETEDLSNKDRIVDDFIKIFKPLITEILNNAEYLKFLKKEKEIVKYLSKRGKEIAELEKEISDNKMKSEDIEQLIAKNKKMLTEIEEDLKKYADQIPALSDKSSLN